MINPRYTAPLLHRHSRRCAGVLEHKHHLRAFRTGYDRHGAVAGGARWPRRGAVVGSLGLKGFATSAQGAHLQGPLHICDALSLDDLAAVGLLHEERVQDPAVCAVDARLLHIQR